MEMNRIKIWHTTSINQGSASTLWDEASLRSLVNEGYFALKTCQRLILVKREGKTSALLTANENQSESQFEVLTGPAAYQFILETICGLKSRLLGETEIVSQFKESFEQYLESPQRDPKLIKIFHKVFMDAKKIRHEHLQKIGLLSYCGLTKSLLNKHYPKFALDPLKTEVAILGSGKLASDLLKVLNKNYNISLHARNTEALNRFSQKYQIKAIDRVDQKDLLTQKVIINTIGTDRKLFFEDFFKQWKMNQFCRVHQHDPSLFIDLSSPSVIETSYGKLEAVYRLDDLFNLAQKMHDEKEAKLQSAMQAISNLTAKRQAHFSPGNFCSWEGYRFA